MNKKIIFSFLSVLILVSGLLVFTGCQEEEKEEVIKIGVTSALTGPYSYIGTPKYEGIKKAFDEINNTIGKQKIKLVIEDNEASVKKALTDYNSFKSQDINIVFAGFSHISAALNPLSKKDKIILMYNSMDPTFSEENEYSFKFYMDSKSDAKKLVWILENKTNLTNSAVVYVNGPEGVLFYNELKEEKGVQGFSFEKSDTDFRTIISKLNSKNIGNVFIIGFPIHVLSFIQQSIELSYSPEFILASAGGYSEITKEIEEYLKLTNTTYVTAWYGKDPNNQNIDYLFGYDAAKLIIKGMKKCDKIKSYKLDDPECLKETIKKEEFLGKTGKIELNDMGTVKTEVFLYTVKDKKLIPYS